MKKLIALLLAAIMVMAIFAGCSSKPPKPPARIPPQQMPRQQMPRQPPQMHPPTSRRPKAKP